MTPNQASSPPRNVRHSRYRLAVPLFSLLVVLGMLLTACGGGSTSNSTPTTSQATTLRVQFAPGQPNPDLFNPFFNNNQGGDWGAQGLLYEELYFTNLYTGQHTPWLATNASYNSDLTQLTFTLRSGVKWNDGQPFTSADVVFTFNLMQAHPALDQNSIWATELKSVSAPDSNTVVFNLKAPDSTALFYIGGVFIVPQHIWSTISGDPAKFANDKNPVGTGPYLLSSFNSDVITYTRNPNYWGNSAGMTPQVQTIQAIATKDNTTTITNMIQGKYDWAGVGWSPDYDTQYKAKDAQHNQDWFAASNTVMLYLNLQKAPFNNLLVRKAISAAINRSQLPQGVALYAKVANPTGVIIPNLNNWISSQYQNMNFQYSASQAGSYLQQAGYTKGSDGFYRDASGKELTMSVDVVNGWSDWDQDVQYIVNDLNAAGIKATLNSQSGFTPYYNAITSGAYDAAISWTNSGPTPYYPYHDMLSSANAGDPIAKKAAVGTNFEGWTLATSNGLAAQTDKLLAQYKASPDGSPAQMQAIQGIEDIMVNQLPVIPLTVNVTWDEYRTANWVGWPDASNPYDVGPPYQMPDAANVILHLKPA